MPEIYIITCSENGKQYVGQTKHNAEYRLKKHIYAAFHPGKTQCSALYSAMRKHGVEKFTTLTLLICEIGHLNEKEILAIEENQTLAPKGYNLNKGGDYRSPVMTPETRIKLSLTKKQRQGSESYGLPFGIVKITIPSKNVSGYRVKVGKIQHDFTKRCLTDEAKMQAAQCCLFALQKGEPFTPSNPRKRRESSLNIPQYITLRGETGFAVNKPGYKRKTFNSVKNDVEENLILAKKYLSILN